MSVYRVPNWFTKFKRGPKILSKLKSGITLASMNTMCNVNYHRSKFLMTLDYVMYCPVIAVTVIRTLCTIGTQNTSLNHKPEPALYSN